ncbi:hypothetical protein HD806DRAFT_543241 [Xylariaceae sp. AK1471]|nr:hypothetical protein HD806DRAFT_543241 [Xylariaceae sp. AK1471]
MRLLRTLSRLRVTVVCVIHQPRLEILDFLNGVSWLSRGHQVYHGDSRSLAGYFNQPGSDISKSPNIADAVLDIISGHPAMCTQSHGRLTIDDMVKSWNLYAPKQHVPTFGSDHELLSYHYVGILVDSAASKGHSRSMQARLCFAPRVYGLDTLAELEGMTLERDSSMMIQLQPPSGNMTVDFSNWGSANDSGIGSKSVVSSSHDEAPFRMQAGHESFEL